jgi:tRNA(Ile)-lysidine synthase
MFDQFKKHINSTLSFLNESKLLIAVSGGIDSVVLAHLCHKLKWNFAIAHCNFNLRGTDSDRDEEFVLNLAENMDVEIFIESFDTENYADSNKVSIQMAARELRYNWFNELAGQLNFDFILTAHHADDNLETFLINLSRGTGLEGLIGIPEINNKIVRPLLPFSREEIEVYAKANKLHWREDSSNESTKYLRNKLRLEVIPKLKEINPMFLQNLIKSQDFLQDSKTIIDDRIDDISEVIIKEINDAEIHFDTNRLLELSNPKAYLYELLNDYGFTEWNDVLNLLGAQSGKQVYSKTHRLLKDRNVLILTENNSIVLESISISQTDDQVETPIGMLCIETSQQIHKSIKSTVFLDKDLLKFPLILRKWQEGDYFYPFGMKGKKKLSKFFKDEKLSLVAKENSWLLCTNNDVVWVVNQRLDERYKVTENTKNILKITLKE